MDNNYVVEWTEEALQDIENIALFIAQDNLEIALALADEFDELGNSLVKFPHKGVPRIYPANRKVRLLIHREYKLVYRIDHNRIIIEQVHKENQER